MVGMEGHRGLFDEMTSELKQRIRMSQHVKTLRQIIPGRGNCYRGVRMR